MDRIDSSVWHQRRQFNSSGAIALAGLILLTVRQAEALTLADLSSSDATQGVKTALEKGALVAVDLLGRTDGFLGNPKVRIPLPGFLQDASKVLKAIGRSKQVDELVTSMNRAAEAAVPMGKQLLVSAVRSMSVTDAKNILTGGDTSVTQFFEGKTRTPLFDKFLPVVNKATEKVGLAARYNDVAAKASGFGLVKKDDANIQHYVTGKSLDGLYVIIGDEEKKIRQDPVGAGSAILTKVFGALK